MTIHHPDITPATWPAVSALLDEALALAPEERDTWLQSLDGERAGHRETLRFLLSQTAAVETGDFLATLPRFTEVAPASTRGPLTELAAGDAIGPYRLLSELGTGGMGAVWLAERSDGQLKRKVALKLPRMVWAKGLAERMARERDILASLEHPRIARLYDAGVDQHGRPYLALEYVQGRPIDIYAKHKALTVRQRVELLLQVCEAVAYAHSRLVIHRDLKPSNILVTDDGQVQLLDFGVAKLMQAEGSAAAGTALTEMVGRALTLDYASPEQVRGEVLTTASDVYSLGVVAYELLSGARPYRLKRGSAAELEDAIESAELPAASARAVEPEARRALRGDLDAILQQALRKAPGQRYRTIEALARDLESHLAGQAVTARPDALWARLLRLARRHPVPMALLGALALALLGGAHAQAAVMVALGVGVLLALWQRRAALQQAERARLEAVEARRQRERAEVVKGFALGLFESADTAAGGSRSTTALDLLRAARERIHRMPVADPAITVELLNSVAYSLIGLGERDEALSASEEALRLAQARLGAAHPLTHAAQLALGEALLQFEYVARAQVVLDAAEAGMRATGNVAGEVHALRLKSLAHLAAGRFDPAITVARDAVELAETRLPAVDKRTRMLAHAALASALGHINQPGRLDAARRAYELAREIHGDRLAAEVVGARAVYASTLIDEGDAQAGLLELKSVIAQQRQLLGNDHVAVKHSFNELGKAALSRGDPVTAIESFRETLRLALAISDAEEHGLQRMNLGAALAAARRLPEAEAELRRALDVFGTLGMNDHLYTRLGRLHLAGVLMRTDRLDEAEAQVGPVLSNPGLVPFELVTARMRAGELYSRQGRHDEALALLEQAVALSAQQPNPSARARVLAALGAAQQAARAYAAAQESLQGALSLYRTVQLEGSPDQADLLVDIARNELALRRIPSAIAAASTAVRYWEQIDNSNRSVGLARIEYARALAASGDTASARRELDLARESLGTSATPSDLQALAETERSVIAAR
jgi:serine/threonine-protein kinase